MPPGQRWGQLRRAAGFLRPQRTAVGIILALILTGAAVNALHPVVHKLIFDRLTAGEPWREVLVGVALLLGLGLLGELVTGVANWLTWRTRLRTNEDLLDRTIARLYSLPMSYHRDETVGGLMTRVERGINGFLTALNDLAFGILPALAYVVIAGAIMLRLEWRLSLLVFGGALAVAAVAAWASAPQTRRDRVLLDLWTRINGRFAEALGGMHTLKSLALEDVERRRFLRGASRANRLVLTGVGFDTTVGATKNTAALVARVAVIGVGGYMALRGEITLGTLVAFVGYLAGIFGPIFGLTGTYAALRRASVALDAVFSILDADPGPVAAARATPQIEGEVGFEGVSFSYQDGIPVLRDFSFEARPGQHIAIVGPSGAGKTTVINLLQRFYEPTSGTIRIDGHDIRDLEPRALRRQIGIVLQETFLFHESVRANILAARPGASMEEVERAARAAHAHDFIERLPRGYDTVVAEGGRSLSGGQRQRIAITRALLKDPPILILDEATSALDAESQAALREALPRLAAGRTTFIISHRLSMVRDADLILVMRDGRLVEAGVHDDLMELDGSYARMVRLQGTASLRPTRWAGQGQPRG